MVNFVKDVTFDEAAQALDVSSGGLLALLHLVGLACQKVRPPGLGIATQCRSCYAVSIVTLGAEQVEGAADYGLVPRRTGPSGDRLG